VTLDQLQQRDARITELETLGRARSRDQDHELAGLQCARDQYWRRLPQALAATRRKAADLEAYARQIGLPLHA
jgi:hypothetical protein